jgi:DNA-binding ferritin-like protein (Dps family)
MTGRSKILLFCSILLAALVIASVLLMYSVSSDVKPEDDRSIYFAAATVFVSILSVVFVYMTKVRKGRYEKMLDKNYFDEYEIIRDAIMNSQLSNNSKKEIKEDILDMLISAQKAGKNVRDVVGDTASFVRDILDSFTRPLHFAVLGVLDSIIIFTLFVLGTTVIQWFEQGGGNFFGIGISTGMVTLFVILAFILLPILKKYTPTHSPWLFMIPIAFGLLFILIAELLREFFYDADAVRSFLDGSVYMISGYAALALFICAVPVFLILKIYVRRRLMQRRNNQ